MQTPCTTDTVGGHVFAGNVIAYAQNSTYGDWFGYVCPTDAEAVVKYAKTANVKVCTFF